ncbi:unnamed protein product [Vitrella brassicaformis CCMP3155]|uniref:Uncharacterized protein n=3 Tax=Vitrella brassicaformis TaxID=1169539 RepID=A0A0G4FSQ9_VITBC|nr:unnamed protein product [Vitrella brassicaformis CCMP3155]|eukprot:CEM17748.1 unnamed protein product [Vitrella brassicaformis CCMP3155]
MSEDFSARSDLPALPSHLAVLLRDSIQQLLKQGESLIGEWERWRELVEHGGGHDERYRSMEGFVKTEKLLDHIHHRLLRLQSQYRDVPSDAPGPPPSPRSFDTAIRQLVNRMDRLAASRRRWDQHTQTLYETCRPTASPGIAMPSLLLHLPSGTEGNELAASEAAGSSVVPVRRVPSGQIEGVLDELRATIRTRGQELERIRAASQSRPRQPFAEVPKGVAARAAAPRPRQPDEGNVFRFEGNYQGSEEDLHLPARMQMQRAPSPRIAAPGPKKGGRQEPVSPTRSPRQRAAGEETKAPVGKRISGRRRSTISPVVARMRLAEQREAEGRPLSRQQGARRLSADAPRGSATPRPAAELIPESARPEGGPPTFRDQLRYRRILSPELNLTPGRESAGTGAPARAAAAAGEPPEGRKKTEAPKQRDERREAAICASKGVQADLKGERERSLRDMAAGNGRVRADNGHRPIEGGADGESEQEKQAKLNEDLTIIRNDVTEIQQTTRDVLAVMSGREGTGARHRRPDGEVARGPPSETNGWESSMRELREANRRIKDRVADMLQMKEDILVSSAPSIDRSVSQEIRRAPSPPPVIITGPHIRLPRQPLPFQRAPSPLVLSATRPRPPSPPSPLRVRPPRHYYPPLGPQLSPPTTYRAVVTPRAPFWAARVRSVSEEEVHHIPERRPVSPCCARPSPCRAPEGEEPALAGDGVGSGVVRALHRSPGMRQLPVHDRLLLLGGEGSERVVEVGPASRVQVIPVRQSVVMF